MDVAQPQHNEQERCCVDHGIAEAGGEEASRLNDAIKKMFELRFARKMELI